MNKISYQEALKHLEKIKNYYKCEGNTSLTPLTEIRIEEKETDSKVQKFLLDFSTKTNP